ncbi:MAG: trigger factor [Firmicutes bacterium]|nr:trigger factor [Bacillota bacterium]
MKVHVERRPGSRVFMEVEVEESRVAEAIDKAYRKLVKQVNIPGFRRGKAPRHVFELHVGKEFLYSEAMEGLVADNYHAAVIHHELDPIGTPKFDVEPLEDGKPFKFTVEVDVRPEVVLGEYKGLTVDKVIMRIDDAKHVEPAIERLREENAELVVVERTEVQEGDFVLIDFEGYVDGQPFPGGAAKGFLLEIGSGMLVEGFEEQLVGAKVNEETEVNLVMPEDYPAEELAGKDVSFKVVVKEIKEKRLPELSDEFVKDVANCESVEELREQMRLGMERAVEDEAERYVRSQLEKLVVDNAELEAPAGLVERELDRLIAVLRNDLARRGFSLEDYMESAGVDMERLRNDFRERAEWNVRRDFVLYSIAENEGIQVAQEEIETMIEGMLSAESDRDQAREEWWGVVGDLLLKSKVMDFLVENAEIRVVEKDDAATEETPGEETE